MSQRGKPPFWHDLVSAVLWYGGAMVIALLYYLLPEWLGYSWLLDRAAGGTILGLVAMISLIVWLRRK